MSLKICFTNSGHFSIWPTQCAHWTIFWRIRKWFINLKSVHIWIQELLQVEIYSIMEDTASLFMSLGIVMCRQLGKSWCWGWRSIIVRRRLFMVGISIF